MQQDAARQKQTDREQASKPAKPVASRGRKERKGKERERKRKGKEAERKGTRKGKGNGKEGGREGGRARGRKKGGLDLVGYLELIVGHRY